EATIVIMVAQKVISKNSDACPPFQERRRYFSKGGRKWRQEEEGKQRKEDRKTGRQEDRKTGKRPPPFINFYIHNIQEQYTGTLYRNIILLPKTRVLMVGENQETMCLMC